MVRSEWNSRTKKEQQTKANEVNDDDENEDVEDEEIWMINIAEKYENRPTESIFQSMCSAEFSSEFRVLAKPKV